MLNEPKFYTSSQRGEVILWMAEEEQERKRYDIIKGGRKLVREMKEELIKGVEASGNEEDIINGKEECYILTLIEEMRTKGEEPNQWASAQRS